MVRPRTQKSTPEIITKMLMAARHRRYCLVVGYTPDPELVENYTCFGKYLDVLRRLSEGEALTSLHAKLAVESAVVI